MPTTKPNLQLTRTLEQTTTDSLKRLHLNTIYRNFMRPLYLHHWVCNFIFKDFTKQSFHGEKILPIGSFSQSLLFKADTRFIDNYISTTLHNQCEGHLSFLPVRSHDSITVGYVISFSSDGARRIKSSHCVPFAPPYIGRFVLDHSTKQLLLFIPSAQHGLITIVPFAPSADEQHLFVIPAEEYDWFTIPNDPVTMKGDVFERELQPIFDKHSANRIPYGAIVNKGNGVVTNNTTKVYQLNNVDVTPDDISDLMASISLSDNNNNNNHTVKSLKPPEIYHPPQPTAYDTMRNMFMDTEDMQPHKESEQIAGTPNICMQPLSTNPNRLDALLSAEQQNKFEEDMINIMHNYKYSLGRRIDLNPFVIPGYEELIKFRDLHHVFHLANSSITRAVNDKCAQIYYSLALSVTPDKPLLSTPFLGLLDLEDGETHEPRQALSITNTGHDYLYHNNTNGKKPPPIGVSKPPREVILRERKRRNRLSAARSNARRQQHLEEMERELKASRILIAQLEMRERRAMEKNEQLRILLRGDCYGAFSLIDSM